ncbi:MAG TPA: hypothetical protein VF909_05345, partial [Roseiflexaceae bacterium]
QTSSVSPSVSGNTITWHIPRLGYLDDDLFALQVRALSGHTDGRGGGSAGNHAANRGDDRSPALPAGRVTIPHRCQRISGAD